MAEFGAPELTEVARIVVDALEVGLNRIDDYISKKELPADQVESVLLTMGFNDFADAWANFAEEVEVPDGS